MKARRGLALAVLSCGLLWVASWGKAADTRGKGQTLPSGNPNAPSRSFLIVLENHSYSQVIGNDAAPYLNSLVRRGALATNYYAVAHPSLPNYLALLGGSTFGVAEDCTDCRAWGSNLATQLSRAGLTWRAYMEDMPAPCSKVPDAGYYAIKHNPFMYFPSIADHPDRCANVVPGSGLDRDLRAGRLPSFSWITPNLCQDGHSCGLNVTDRYLSRLVPRLEKRLGPSGFVVLTYDEADSSAEAGQLMGGRVVTILIGPEVRVGVRLAARFDHYSLLRTFEQAYGLEPLRQAGAVPSMAAAFAHPPRLR